MFVVRDNASFLLRYVKSDIQLCFIKEPMINTYNEQDEIIKQVIRKIILTLLKAFAEKEKMKVRQGKLRR